MSWGPKGTVPAELLSMIFWAMRTLTRLEEHAICSSLVHCLNLISYTIVRGVGTTGVWVSPMLHQGRCRCMHSRPTQGFNYRMEYWGAGRLAIGSRRWLMLALMCKKSLFPPFVAFLLYFSAPTTKICIGLLHRALFYISSVLHLLLLSSSDIHSILP